MGNSAAVLLMIAFSGCVDGAKPYKTAPVSGIVTLDGKPLGGAHVTFMPVPDAQGSILSGPEALGDTNDDGRYALKTVFGDEGASVGKNRVMVSTRKTELDPNNPDRSVEIAKERVPGKYFTEQAPLVFDVPAGGSRSADFELTTK
jgi:hypothetical protein